jgi:hypothetical protein
MRCSTRQFALALLAVVVGPLLGVGASARAGYLATDPRLGAALLENGPSGAGSGLASAAGHKHLAVTYGPDDGRGPGVPCPGERLPEVRPIWWMAMALGQSRAGSPPAPPVGGGSVAPAAVVAGLSLPPLPMVGWLYIDGVDWRPPPFAARLFRPPRPGPEA